MRVEISGAELFDHPGDAFAFAHARRLEFNARSPKWKIAVLQCKWDKVTKK
jgi:hypothetical protein